ncbi:MAG: acetyltransferase [Chloroflexi bacterium]|nr:acetyltransferase [Chloroflexota bacterium]
MDKIVIVGASGHGKVVADVVERDGKFAILGWIDSYKPAGGEFFGYPVLGAEDALFDLWQRREIVGGLIAIGDNWSRGRMVEKIHSLAADFVFVTAVHPSAQIARGVSIGVGTVLMAGVVVNSDSRIGAHCILNTRASLDHDCVMDDCSSLAPGVTTGGTVTIGAYSAVSLGVNILHGKTVGAHTVVGAGALVREDLPDHCVAYGVPARVIRRRAEGEKYL